MDGMSLHSSGLERETRWLSSSFICNLPIEYSFGGYLYRFVVQMYRLNVMDL